MKYWLNWQAPIYDWLNKKRKLRDLPLNAVVDVYDGESDGVRNVEYQGINGWIDTKYLEPYLHALPYDLVDLSDIETPDNTDAKQYVIWDGAKQVNMCGEICVAYILGMPLSGILANWKVKRLPFYRRIFGSGKASGTTSRDLVELLALADVSASLLESSYKKYSPYMLYNLIQNNWLIVACNIDGGLGYLRGSGVGHWVLVMDVVQDRQGFGWVDVFNPFNNCVERYSWREFLASTRNYPYGVIVEKKGNINHFDRMG